MSQRDLEAIRARATLGDDDGASQENIPEDPPLALGEDLEDLGELHVPRVGRRILAVARRENGGVSPVFSPTFPDAVDGVFVRIINLTAPDPSSPELVSLTFSLIVVPETPIGLESFPDGTDMYVGARLIWGAGKGRHEAFIDIRSGTRVTLEASTLLVDAFYVGTIGPTVRIACSVTYGSVGAKINTFTSGQIALAAGGVSRRFVVPLYAGAVQTYTDADPAVPAATEMQLFMDNGTGATIARLNLYTGSANVAPPVYPLPAGSYFFRLVNNGAAPITFLPRFDLVL